jgi:ribosome-associated toxin RatA of RatAB toxin-antitoxin module
LPHIDVAASIATCDPDVLFDHVACFDAYPEIAENVRTVSVLGTGDRLISQWEVTFRKGILKWEEEDRIDRPARRIAFTQTRGDLALFAGGWEVVPAGDGARVAFTAEFDLGIPSLASMLDPAAGRTLAKNAHELIDAFAAATGPSPVCFEDDAQARRGSARARFGGSPGAP